MTTILHVSCSSRGPASESGRLSRKIVDLVLEGEPAGIVVERMIGDGSIAHVDADYALAQHSAEAEVSRHGATARSDALIDELEASDVVVIGTPMHNLGVPSVLKSWIDHVVRARRTFNVGPGGKVGTLRDRPVFVGVASGGVFSGARARQPDFLTPYLKAILGSIGLHNLVFFSVEGTGHGPDALAETRAATDQALRAYFASFTLDGRRPAQKL
jgi:FMN-dependent NADH-azoreductase